MSEEPEPLTDRQLEIIEIVAWILFTVIVMVSIWFPYVAVGCLFLKWGSGVLGLLGKKNSDGE